MRRGSQRSHSRLGLNMSCILLLLLSLMMTTVTAASSSSKNLYATLGVSKDCSSADLKKAYRKQALKHHPDKQPPEKRTESEAKFKAINEAFETLSDEKKRAAYDQFGDAGLDPHFASSAASSASGGVPPSDFFSFFQQQQQQPKSSSPQNSFSFGSGSFSPFFGSSGTGDSTNLDLSELLRQMMMPGASPRTKSSPKRPSAKSYTRNVYCTLEELAKGATKKLKVKHSPTAKDDVYTISLKRGWKAGTKIKFPPRASNPHHMTFVVQEKPHPYLERHGNDLLYKCNLTPSQAKKGARLKIPLPDGHVLNLSTESHSPIQHKDKITIPHRGMPIQGGPDCGDLVIQFSISPSQSSTSASSIHST